jgi:hypothetical protein
MGGKGPGEGGDGRGRIGRGVKQPLNPSRHPSMDEASSEAGRTVATDSTLKKGSLGT